MDNSAEEEDIQFFDTRQDMTDLSSDFCDNHFSNSMVNYDVLDSLDYQFWTKSPYSVQERRRKFLEWMGPEHLDRIACGHDESVDASHKETCVDADQIAETCREELRTLNVGDEYLSSRSSLSLQLNEAVDDECRIRNLDNGTEFVVDAFSHDGLLYKLREVGSSRLLSFEEFQRVLGSSPLVQLLLRKEAEESVRSSDMKMKAKRGWLNRLAVVTCLMNAQKEFSDRHHILNQTDGAMIRQVRVHPHRKRSKELSSLLTGQEFFAHEGSILTMKFSVDGQYLASGGQDGTVRVWKVMEIERTKDLDTLDTDPLNLHAIMKQHTASCKLNADKQKSTKGLRRTTNQASVIIPPKVFRICEKPMHEFKGHSSKVLDLSWSKKGFLLSSSVDKTVRLWKVGCNQCLKNFSHNNYVTCIDFNPMDENYFISGSIDGKIRIWEVLGCRVVDWTDTREIVTAVCFRPDGKGGIVGSLNGNCRFYAITDNHLELDAQICLQGKKKLQGKHITGFQFSPTDPSKVMVTSADSVVRILCGVDIICKFKGLRGTGSQISASFTYDGSHIVSATDESNIHIWNYSSQEKTSKRAKKKCACESFVSKNASIALPWSGMKTKPDILPSSAISGGLLDNNLQIREGHNPLKQNLNNEVPFSSSDCLSLGRGFLLDLLSKGAATWPEERLKNLSPKALSPLMLKSEYKMLKSFCQSMFSSPHLWGLVIVTAGWDGRIRTFLNYGLPIRL